MMGLLTVNTHWNISLQTETGLADGGIPFVELGYSEVGEGFGDAEAGVAGFDGVEG